MCIRTETVFGAVQFSVVWHRYRSMLPRSAIPVQLSTAFISNVLVFLIVGKLPSFRVGVWDDKRWNVKQRWNDDWRRGGLRVLGRNLLPLSLCPLHMSRGDLGSNQGLRGEKPTPTCLSYNTDSSLSIKLFASAEKSRYDQQRYRSKWQ